MKHETEQDRYNKNVTVVIGNHSTTTRPLLPEFKNIKKEILVEDNIEF